MAHGGEQPRTLAELRPVAYKVLADFSPDVQSAVVAELGLELETVAPPPKNAEHKQIERDLVSDRYYAISNDELGLLAVGASLAEGLFSALAHPVPLIASLAVLWFRYRQKRVELTAEEAAVLLALKRGRGKGMTVDEVRAAIPDIPALTRDRLIELLAKLKKAISRGGEEKELVTEQGGHFWARNV